MYGEVYAKWPVPPVGVEGEFIQANTWTEEVMQATCRFQCSASEVQHSKCKCKYSATQQVVVLSLVECFCCEPQVQQY